MKFERKQEVLIGESRYLVHYDEILVEGTGHAPDTYEIEVTHCELLYGDPVEDVEEKVIGKF